MTLRVPQLGSDRPFPRAVSMGYMHPGICLPEKLVPWGLLGTHNWVKPSPGCDSETSFLKAFLRCPTLSQLRICFCSALVSNPVICKHRAVVLFSFPQQGCPCRATLWCHTNTQSYGSGQNNTCFFKSRACNNSSQSQSGKLYLTQSGSEEFSYVRIYLPSTRCQIQATAAHTVRVVCFSQNSSCCHVAPT